MPLNRMFLFMKADWLSDVRASINSSLLVWHNQPWPDKMPVMRMMNRQNYEDDDDDDRKRWNWSYWSWLRWFYLYNCFQTSALSYHLSLTKTAKRTSISKVIDDWFVDIKKGGWAVTVVSVKEDDGHVGEFNVSIMGSRVAGKERDYHPTHPR